MRRVGGARRVGQAGGAVHPVRGAAVRRQTWREVDDHGDVIARVVEVHGRHLALPAVRQAHVEDAVALGRVRVPAHDAQAEQALQPRAHAALVEHVVAAEAGGVVGLEVRRRARAPDHGRGLRVEVVDDADESLVRHAWPFRRPRAGAAAKKSNHRRW
jgi:hypothetical protein